MTVVVAAGNAASDACLSTPAAGPGVITVGNLDSNDNRSPSSNYGYLFPCLHDSNMYSDCIDIWAPGTNILSISAFGSNTATAVKTGTSMACPHVVGIVGSLKTRMTFAQTTDYFFVRSRVSLLSTVANMNSSLVLRIGLLLLEVPTLNHAFSLIMEKEHALWVPERFEGPAPSELHQDSD